jgi:hypothetical protein
MLKNILKLDGAQKLTKNEQKSIKGGVNPSEPICGFVIWNATEIRCLAYDAYYKPVYLGNNQCSLYGNDC